MGVFKEDLVFLNQNFDNAAEVIRFGGEKLMAEGYVKDGFIEGVLKREKESPTGLPTEGIFVAMPHTLEEYVDKPAAVFIQLDRPVIFTSMEDLKSPLPVQLVFELAINEPSKQLGLLKALMTLFKDQDKLISLKNAKTVDQAMDVLKSVSIEEKEEKEC